MTDDGNDVDELGASRSFWEDIPRELVATKA